MKKKLPLIAVFFLLLLNLHACSREKKEDPAFKVPESDNPVCGDTIIEASIADARILIPILASDGASGQICSLVFNGLVKYDKNLILTGDLAQSWEIKDNGLTIIFHLKQGVKWHDGMPFSAQDVKFTYEKLIDPNVATPYSGDFEKVQQVEIIDEYTLKIDYKEPFSPGLASWAMNIMPKHLLENEDMNNTAFGRNPVGTGPYKFSKWKTQDVIILTANDEYFEGRPFIDRYIFRIIPDSATMFLELQNLSIDFMGLSPLQYVRQVNALFFEKNYQKFRYQGFNFTYLGYNLKDPLFADARVRQALNYAVDKNEIIDGVLLGTGTVCTGPFAFRSWAYNDKVNPAAYDPEKAQELLRQAGWVLNQSGILEKEGRIFEFTIITNQGNEERKRAAEIIQKRLDKVGIKVKIKVIEWSAFINEFINKRNFDAVLLGWSLSLDPDIFDIWHSSKTREGEFNFISYSNEEVDKLLERGRREFDQEERKKIYNRIHEIIYEEQPYMFLYNPNSLPIINKRFKGIEVAPAGISHNFIKWYVPENEQKYITR
ncbi:MAG: peptide-binding protein [Candidatus Omnitrophica bacterium]|nr:peptide-binding protein [Candidatus Omnitrophota bacterium]